MITKFLEICDHATCIPAIAMKMCAGNEIEAMYLWRCGYPPDGSGIVLLRLSDQGASSDPYHWAGNRTMQAAHLYIEQHFDALNDGDVVDARVYLGEATSPVEPEIWTR